MIMSLKINLFKLSVLPALCSSDPSLSLSESSIVMSVILSAVKVSQLYSNCIADVNRIADV